MTDTTETDATATPITDGDPNPTWVYEPDTLRNYWVPSVLSTGSVDLISEFYNPYLRAAESYRRGVGYFTADWLAEVTKGLTALVENGGRVKWLISPIVDERDWETFKDAVDAHGDGALRVLLERQLPALEEGLATDTRNTLAWLIADGIIELRFVVPCGPLTGDLHDKFGIIEDQEGNKIAFHGSANDSRQSTRNLEGIRVDFGWVGGRESAAVEERETQFQQVWRDEVNWANVYTMTSAIENEIAELRTTDERPYTRSPQHLATGDGGTSTTSPNNAIKAASDTPTLWDHQREALHGWLENDRRGLLKMVTGSGKTYVAIGAMDILTRHDEMPFTVISVPQGHLANQWTEELRDWGFTQPLSAVGSDNPNWRANLKELVLDVNMGIVDQPLVLTTHDTIKKDDFQSLVRRVNHECLLVGDEVHGLGSQQRQDALIDAYDYRMGLSATPERVYDPDGTATLMSYFDDIVYEFGLDDAIPEYLSPYEYKPVIVELTDEEFEEYVDQSQQLAATIGAEDATEQDISRLSQQRAEIHKTARRKLDALDEILDELDDITGTLVFVSPDQRTDVQHRLEANGVYQHKFTQHENLNQRDELIDALETDELNALVGINCLDEGVDIPSADTAILMSNDANPRQFIQRRGRILRQHESKDQATIYDVLVTPPRETLDELMDSQRTLIESELDRVEQFAAAANNTQAVQGRVSELREALAD
jgi:superfamily II DNA or RNA helicase